MEGHTQDRDLSLVNIHSTVAFAIDETNLLVYDAKNYSFGVEDLKTKTYQHFADGLYGAYSLRRVEFVLNDAQKLEVSFVKLSAEGTRRLTKILHVMSPGLMIVDELNSVVIAQVGGAEEGICIFDHERRSKTLIRCDFTRDAFCRGSLDPHTAEALVWFAHFQDTRRSVGH
jgi:hypothetical protein